MRLRALSTLVLALAIPLLALNADAGSILLGTAASFAVLGGSTVTNTGATVLTGDVGVYPGTSITGFLPGIVTGTTDAGDAFAHQAQADLTTAITNFGLDGPGNSLSGSSYATTNGQTLSPGVYSTGSTLEVAGALNLNFNNQSNASFIFLVGSSLTVDGSSTIVLENVGPGDSLFWVMPTGSATVGTNATFEGNILAGISITVDAGANILCGRALASTGEVSLNDNVISTTCENAPVTTGGSTSTGNAFLEASNGLSGASSSAPEPNTLWLLAAGLLVVGWFARGVS